jgi:hypothetical protein
VRTGAQAGRAPRAEHKQEESRPSRAERKQEEHALLREILREHHTREAQVREWIERTGKSERAFYRRLAEFGLTETESVKVSMRQGFAPGGQ